MGRVTERDIARTYKTWPLVSPSQDELVGKAPAPSFEDWKKQFPISLRPDSPRSIRQLYEDIYKVGEVALIVENGQLKRFGRVAVMDVFYKDGRQTLKLGESRYKLKPGRTVQEFLEGDKTAVTNSPARPAENSVSERMAIAREEPKDAMVRALVEELFDSRLNGEDDPRRKQIEQTLRRNIRLARGGKAERKERGAFAFGSSYQGIPSVHEQFDATLTITPGIARELSMDFDKQGRPQPFYEYIPAKGYLNVYEWTPVEQTRTAKHYSRRTRPS